MLIQLIVYLRKVLGLTKIPRNRTECVKTAEWNFTCVFGSATFLFVSIFIRYVRDFFSFDSQRERVQLQNRMMVLQFSET